MDVCMYMYTQEPISVKQLVAPRGSWYITCPNLVHEVHMTGVSPPVKPTSLFTCFGQDCKTPYGVRAIEVPDLFLFYAHTTMFTDPVPFLCSTYLPKLCIRMAGLCSILFALLRGVLLGSDG